MSLQQDRLRAPEFPAGLQWLNTEAPLSLKALRGKIVLLDFWTYCCINCMHVIPDLKKLEKKYPDELVVIGVHSAKFDTERETENIRQAILRYEIEHPVINDRDMRVWDEYAVRAWPTLDVIDPEGYIVGRISGEGVFEELDKKIAELIGIFSAKGSLKRGPIPMALEKNRAKSTLLSFPGKLLADAASDRLFIADSNHNRILVSSLGGEIQEVIGEGEIGLRDGSFAEARFNHPQGMALDGDILYIADTENHAIRRVDLKGKSVTTTAGTGKQAAFGKPGGSPQGIALNSPWDLVLQKGVLFVAMAGSHQIWKLNPKTGEAAPYAGSGAEALRDGPLMRAALAQPSGITSDGEKLYFADSEVSAIRSADLDGEGQVETLVGLDLFEFGDQDGRGREVRLQHPLGVAFHEGKIWVADTYNNKIKILDPATKASRTFLGDGEAGLVDGAKARLDEPGGISVARGKLYIADTNNHVIRVADLPTGELRTLELTGIEKLMFQGPKEKFSGEIIRREVATGRPGAGRLRLDLKLPAGFEVNAQAPTQVKLSAEGAAVHLDQNPLLLERPDFPLEIPLHFKPGEGKVIASFVVYYCEADKKSLCLFKKARIEQALRVSPENPSSDLGISLGIER